MPTFPTYKLGDVAEIILGQSPESKSYNTKGEGLPFFQGKSEFTDWFPIPNKWCTEPKKIAEPLDILLSVRAPVGPTNVAKEKCCIGRGLAAIRYPECYKYVLYYLRSVSKHLESKATGTTFSSISGDVIRNLSIPLPPLPTQHQIVSRIESLFAELDKAEAHLRTAQQQLKTYRQAVLKSAFEECTNFEKIINYFDVTGGLTKNSQREKFPIKMPYLRVANVYFNRLDLSEIKEIGIQESEVKEKLLKKGDLLFVEGNGSKEQIGRVAIWDGSVENCLHQNHIIKGRPRGQVSSKYALYYLISDLGREQIVEVASSTSGLYTLSTDKVRNLKIPYIPLSEQQRIAEEIESRLSQAEAAEARIAESLQKTEALRQSILKKAFSGELV